MDYPRRPTSIPRRGCCKIKPGDFVSDFDAELTSSQRVPLTCLVVYIGDASTLSILQLIRIIVENTAGSEMGSPFIDDPKRHRIMENIIKFPENTRIPCQLPDEATAGILIDSYFTNVSVAPPLSRQGWLLMIFVQTCGLIEVFDRHEFLQLVDACYTDPPSSDKYFLCHLFLVLALGLLLAAPVPGSPEEAVIRKQLSAQPDRAELFFRSAKSMCDPGAGFEDADFWSIQALSLMTIYMLVVSKRNTAYAYLGWFPSAPFPALISSNRVC